MRKTNYKMLALSQLSFIILSGNYSSDEVELAKYEIERRLSKTGCSYEEFMEWEKDTIALRGSDISNYLISDDPTAQQLMELYFDYIYTDFMEQGKLLFSEIMLCNRDSQKTFFTKLLEKELARLSKVLESDSLSPEEIEQIRFAFDALKERYNKKSSWLENSITDAVANTVVTNSSLMSVKKYEAFEKKYADFDFENLSLLDKVQVMFFMLQSILIYDNDVVDSLNMHYIAYKDYLRLSKQRKSIEKSFKNDIIDYSFVDKKIRSLKKK